jgi:hypothetical protein
MGKKIEVGTTTFLNVEGRANFLMRVNERMNCCDIEGRILTEAERFAYAICEELDGIKEKLNEIDEKVRDLIDCIGQK